MRSFSGGFVTAMNTRRHEFYLTLVIHARMGAGDIYLCDTRKPNIAGHFPLIRKDGWGELSTLAPSDEQNLSIGAVTVEFVNQVIPGYGRLSDYLRLDPEMILCEIFYNFKVGSTIYTELAFPGVIQGQPIEFNEMGGKISIQSLHQVYLDRPMLLTIDALNYPDADPSALNKVIPICLGSVGRVPGSMIKREAFNIINSHDPNAGVTRVVFCECPTSTRGEVTFGRAFIETTQTKGVYWGDVPIQSGDAGLPLSQNLNAYIGMLLRERADDNEFILTTRASGGFPFKTVTVGNGGEYRQIAVPFTVPGDLVNPVLQNISLPVYRDVDTNPGNLAVRVTKILSAYGDPFGDFYGDNFDQSLGYYGWPSGDVGRRNLSYEDVTTAARDNNSVTHSFDAPLEAGRRYFVKFDADNVNQNFDSNIIGHYSIPIHEMRTEANSYPGYEADGAYRFPEDAWGLRAGGGWENLGGAPYLPMSIRGGGGASLYTKDTSPLDTQSGTFVGLFSIGPKGIIARAMKAALSAPGNAGDTASLEVISLTRGPTLGQSVITLTFTKDDFTEDLHVVANPVTPSNANPTGSNIDRIYYLVQKACSLTLIPPGDYAVRFSGSTNPPPPVSTNIPPPDPTPTQQPSRFETWTSGIAFLGGVGTSVNPVTRPASLFREGVGRSSAVYLTPPAFPPPNTAPPPLPRVQTPTGVPIHGMFEIVGARFTTHAGFDGYSLAPVDNINGNPRLAIRRDTTYVDFDVALPSGTVIKADLQNELGPKDPSFNIRGALRQAGVPNSYVNESSFSVGLINTIIKFNGLFDTAMSYKQAILKMGWEGHLEFGWEDKARISELYQITSGVVANSFTIAATEIAATRRIKDMTISRSDIAKVANFILLKYARDWSGSGPNAQAIAKGFSGDVPILVQSIAPYQSVIEFLDLYSIMLYGRLERADLFKLDLISDENSATEIGTFFIWNYGRPKDLVEITLHTSKLAVEDNDIGAFNAV